MRKSSEWLWSRKALEGPRCYQSSELDWGGENALTTFGDATLSIHSKLSYWAYKGFYLIGTKEAPRPVKDRV